VPLSSERGSVPSPLGELLEIFARPWTMHILWALSEDGPTRFGALRRKVGGISSRLLTLRLRALEDKGLVYREYKSTIPPEVTYGLTERVKSLGDVFAPLCRLAHQWQDEDSNGNRSHAKRSFSRRRKQPSAA
jgi:DNA-binding HxlR family transcriptional regulator